MTNIAQEIIRQQKNLEAERSTFENHWADVARFVFPRQDDFFNENREEGDKRTKNRFDDTAILALDRGAAAIESILTPRNAIWHNLRLPKELDDDQEAQEWIERVVDFLFERRYSTLANFCSQVHETYMSLLAFGTGVLIVEDVLGKGVRYKSSHIAEHHFMENIHGKIDRNYRKYRLTAQQAAEKFGEENLPEIILNKLDKTPHEKSEFIHAVLPNPDNEEFPFDSFHVSIEGNKLLDQGGFRSFPYIISRWTTSPNEVYGRSPAMSALAEIKMLNAMKKTDIRARHLAVDPPILAAGAKTIRRNFGKPGSINYGTLDDAGNPLVRPYQAGTAIALSNDGIDQSRRFINDTFFVTLFQILVEAPAMTATEVLQRAQEKGALLSPTAGRQMSEMLGPMIEREISIYESYGLFEDGGRLEMPDSVKEIGGVFEVEYTNPLSRMQKSDEALATERTVQSMLAVAQFEPSIVKRIDFKEYADIIREAHGAPARLYKSDEELQAEAEAEAQAQQLQQIVDAAPQVAGAVKDIAQAQSFSEG